MTEINHYLVLAAQRRGVVNELAERAGVSHKCLMPMQGRPLIEHVLQTLHDMPEASRITISIDAPEVLRDLPLIQALEAEGRLSIIDAGATLFDSIEAALPYAEAFPVIITTADNVLITSDMFRHFADGLGGLDTGIAMIRKEVLLEKYPEGQKRFHRFADGEFSNCNLYALLTPQALASAEFFRGGGQFAKSLTRVMKAFGLVNMIGYRFAWFGRDKAMWRLSKRAGVKIAAIDMPFPEAPIDVDNPRTARIADEILAARATS